MANNQTPSLSNYSWHMAQPSPIETSLASKVDDPNNPSAMPLLMMYRAQNDINSDNYNAGLQQNQQTQIAQANANRELERVKGLATLLKDAGATPGMTTSLRSAGALDPGVDTGALDAAANAKALATNIGTGGRGLGAMGMAGFTNLAPSAATITGDPTVEQGPAAIVQAAALRAAGKGGGAGKSGITARVDSEGNVSYTAKNVPQGTDPASIKTMVGGPNYTSARDQRIASATAALAAARARQAQGQ